MADRGFNELLQYQMMIEPGVMLLKSGAYLTGFSYQGPDIESMSNAEREWQSAAYNNAVKRLGDGWMIHQIIVRAPSSSYPKGDFDEPTNIVIDLERKLQFTDEGSHFETFPYLFLTYMPPKHESSPIKKKIGDFLMGRSREDVANHIDRNITQIEEVLRNFKMSFSQTMNLKRLGLSAYDDGETGDSLLKALNLVINDENRLCVLPDPPSSLDSWLSRELENGDYFIYDGKYTLVLSTDGLPPECFPNMLSEVEHLPIPLEWSSRYIVTDDHYARGLISSIRGKWAQKEQPFLDKMMNKQGRVDAYAVAMVEESDENAALVEQGEVVFGHYTSCIILRGDDMDDLNRMAGDVRKAFERRGFNLRPEARNALEAFIGSFPGHGRENVRKPYIHSLNWADMTPNSTDWSGDEFCPCPMPNYPKGSPALIQAASIGTTPFRLNLHVDDVGHTLILGPTGAGKSTLLCLIASQHDRYPGSQIFVFDKGRSMMPLTKACRKAIHYDLGKLGTELGGLCPLAAIDTPEEQAWAGEYLDVLLQLMEAKNPADKIGAEDRNMLRDAVSVLARSTTKPSQRTMTNFLTTVQSRKVRTLLKYYQLGEGAGGIYLDGRSNDIEYQDFVTFEIEDLMNVGDDVLIPVLLFLFHQIENRLTGRPTLLIIDEAWLALSKPVFSEKIREWLKVLRKANCAVIMATQQVGDIEKSPITGVIVESCPTKIFLPNPEAKNTNNARMYTEVFGLNDKQISLIANAVRKRQYYYISPNGKRLFELNLGPVALSFVGAGSKEDLARVNALENMYHDRWPYYWLRERGVDERYAEIWMKEYERSQEEVA